MKLKKHILILLLPLFVVLLSCDKNEPKKNETFYCKVNREAFRPDKDNSPVGGIGSSPLSIQYNNQTKTLTIYSRNNPRFVGLKIVFVNSVEVGSYTLSSDVNKNIGIFTPDRTLQNPDDIYSNTGIFTIAKIDGFNISGAFEFNCTSSKTGKEFKITEGQFNNVSYY
jgi:hypothetical protein